MSNIPTDNPYSQRSPEYNIETNRLDRESSLDEIMCGESYVTFRLVGVEVTYPVHHMMSVQFDLSAK